MIINCHRCTKPMTLVGQHWVCGAHEQPFTVPAGGASEALPTVQTPGQFDRLPSILGMAKPK
jgi:hypothetical protein